jgi:hypothetical protein
LPSALLAERAEFLIEQLEIVSERDALRREQVKAYTRASGCLNAELNRQLGLPDASPCGACDGCAAQGSAGAQASSGAQGSGWRAGNAKISGAHSATGGSEPDRKPAARRFSVEVERQRTRPSDATTDGSARLHGAAVAR